MYMHMSAVCLFALVHLIFFMYIYTYMYLRGLASHVSFLPCPTSSSLYLNVKKVEGERKERREGRKKGNRTNVKGREREVCVSVSVCVYTCGCGCGCGCGCWRDRESGVLYMNLSYIMSQHIQYSMHLRSSNVYYRA